MNAFPPCNATAALNHPVTGQVCASCSLLPSNTLGIDITDAVYDGPTVSSYIERLGSEGVKVRREGAAVAVSIENLVSVSRGSG